MKKFLLLAFSIALIIAVGVNFNEVINFLTPHASGAGLAMALPIGWSARQRALFNLAKSSFPNGYTPAPSYIRVEAVIDSTTGKIDFTFTKTGTEAKTERKLDRNDSFVMSEMGLFLTAQDSARVGCEVLQSYPNPEIFTGNAKADAKTLEVIYSGSTKLTIADRVELEAFPNVFFRHVPQVQKNAGIAEVVEAAANSQFDIKNAMYELGSIINLDGSDDATITVDYPKITGSALTAGGTLAYKVVFFATGYLIKNGSGKRISS
jgi:hypothetical protein